MLLIVLLSVFAFVSTAAVVVGCSRLAASRRNKIYFPYWAFLCNLVGGVVLGVTIVMAMCVLGDQYNKAISIPNEIAALDATIAEQSAYISTGDVSLGSVLEGIEIKKALFSAISERNNLIATAKTIRRNSWVWFKVPGY